jgi:hypothetical protein
LLDNIKAYGPVEEVKLIRDRMTGQSRSFGFAQFSTVDEARYFLSVTKKAMVVDGYTLSLEFSKSNEMKPTVMEYKDWICSDVQP